MRIRSIAIMWSICIVGGCSKEKEPPLVDRPLRITATVCSQPDHGILPLDSVEVPAARIDEFMRLIVPRQTIKGGVSDEINYLIAEVTLHYADGVETKITVRWTGHNPAAVSLNGINYYYADTDEFPDGAIRIVRLLREYEFEAKNAKRDGAH